MLAIRKIQSQLLPVLMLLLLAVHFESMIASAEGTVFMQQQQQQQQQQEQQRRTMRVASVVRKGTALQLLPDKLVPGALAQGELQLALNSTGWDVLDIRSGEDSQRSNDTLTMLAAGMLEGYLTADRISMQYDNMLEAFFPAADKQRRQRLLPAVRQFLKQQREWARQLSVAQRQDPVARHVGLVLAQLDGLIAGFLHNEASIGHRDDFVLLMLNAVGDLIDLTVALNETKPDYDRMSNSEFRRFVQQAGHCSALVKVTPGYERMFMGHSSWFVYAGTLRIYKHYSFNLTDPATAATKMSFSSYPGFLESLDDFYIMNNGMVMLQTTNSVFNTSLYRYVSTSSLLSWQRVRVANQIARSGSEWAKVIQQHNSGTYNNQYMVIDTRRFHVQRGIENGALTIVEQIPGLVEWSDQTKILRTGYWPSYNVPFHERVYNLSGYPEVVRKRGVDFSYQLAPRAKIFRREAGSVISDAAMGRILRFNEYKTDPYSEGNACNSICCRGDLMAPGEARPDGCYDSKFTNDKLVPSLTSFAISGPSLGDKSQPLPPFSWKQFPNVSHVGLPYTYAFDWVAMQPRK